MSKSLGRYPTSSFSTPVLPSPVRHKTLRGRPPLLHLNGALAPTRRLVLFRSVGPSIYPPLLPTFSPVVLIVLSTRRPVGPHSSRFRIRFSLPQLGEMLSILLILPCLFVGVLRNSKLYIVFTFFPLNIWRAGKTSRGSNGIKNWLQMW